MFALLLAASLSQPSARDLLPLLPHQPGCALDVRQGDRVLEQAATGLANMETGTPNRLDTVFEIGSVSKQFIGAGLARLAADGKLRLSDPIRHWLPELPPLYDGITIDMLAHHTSGIRSWNNLAELTGRGEDSTGYDNLWVLHAAARQRRLNHAPGTEYLYSNSNFVLSALIIERASGEALNDFYRRAFFGPLGMTSTRWRTDFRQVVPRRAQAYDTKEQGRWRLDVPLNDVAGAGGLLSSLDDLQRWAAVLADPSPEQKAWVDLLLRPGILKDGTVLRYGMGVELARVNGQPALAHAGSTGSYRAWLGIFAERKLSVALLCNSGAVNTEELGPEVARRFLPTEAEKPSAKLLAPAGLAGLYRNLANDSTVPVTVDAGGLHLAGGVAFGGAGDRLATADGSRTLMVERGAGGQVRGLRVTRVGNSAVALQRVRPWSPTIADLRALVGRYRSDEVDGIQVIEVNGAGLVWRDPSGAVVPLRPLYNGAFDAAGTSWTLRFTPRTKGTMALDLSITRARRIRFVRVS